MNNFICTSFFFCREIKCILKLYHLYLPESVALCVVVRSLCFVYTVYYFSFARAFFLRTVPTSEWGTDGELSHLLIQFCGERKIHGTKRSRGGKMQHRKRLSFKAAGTLCPCIKNNLIGNVTFIFN
jgi:hypothetical protein